MLAASEPFVTSTSGWLCIIVSMLSRPAGFCSALALARALRPVTRIRSLSVAAACVTHQKLDQSQGRIMRLGVI
jgi:hypothetical protein